MKTMWWEPVDLYLTACLVGLSVVFALYFYEQARVDLTPTFFETHYVTQRGSGNRDGTSPRNAFSVEDINNPDNWGIYVAEDNLIGPGDTVYMLGGLVGPIKPAIPVSDIQIEESPWKTVKNIGTLTLIVALVNECLSFVQGIHRQSDLDEYMQMYNQHA